MAGATAVVRVTRRGKPVARSAHHRAGPAVGHDGPLERLVVRAGVAHGGNVTIGVGTGSSVAVPDAASAVRTGQCHVHRTVVGLPRVLVVGGGVKLMAPSAVKTGVNYAPRRTGNRVRAMRSHADRGGDFDSVQVARWRAPPWLHRGD